MTGSEPKEPQRDRPPLRAPRPTPSLWRVLGMGALITLGGTLVLLGVVFVFILAVCSR